MATSPDWRAAPERPAIVPAFAMGFALWGACATTYGSLRSCSQESCIELASISALCVIGATALAFAVPRRRLVMLCVLAAFCGTLVAGVGSYGVKSTAEAVEHACNGPFHAVLVEDSRETDHGEQALVEVEEAGGSVRALASFANAEPMLRGERYEVTATASIDEGRDDDYLWSKGTEVRISVTSKTCADEQSPHAVLCSARRRAIEGFDPEATEGRLLDAIVCGYRHDLRDVPEYGAFQTCGLAHLVAVSGAHLSIVAGLMMQALRCLRVRRSIVVAVIAPMLVAYLVFSGMPASAIRATVMSIIALSSFYARRRSSSMSALGIGMCLMVATSPQASVSASFALSCLATAGIVLFCPIIEYKLDALFGGRWAFISESLALTLSASLPSQLYATSMFGLLPIVSPLANLACGPLFAPICSVGLVAALSSVFSAQGGMPLVQLASALAWVLERVAGLLSQIPYASIPVVIEAPVALAISFAVCAFIWTVWANLTYRVVLAAIAAIIAMFACSCASVMFVDEVVMLDVGQGDSILLRSRGQTMLIDTGNQDSKLIAALGRNHVYRLDSVLVTHADDDHYGSIDAISKAVHVERGIVSARMLECPDDACEDVVSQLKGLSNEVVGIEQGDTFEVGAFSCRVIWPHGFVDDGGNADSLCLEVSYDGDGDGSVDVRSLFTGDAEKDQLEAMISEGMKGRVDILKVGHHGSRDSLTKSQADYLKPAVALIGVGEHNRYGHPNEDTLDVLGSCGCKVFRTDEDGDICCSLSADGIRVRTMK